MEIAALYLLNAIVFALSLWLGLKIFDSGNPDNSLGTAAFLGGIFALPTFVGSILPFLSLVAFMILLIKYYDLGILRSLAVVFFMGFMSVVARGLVAAPFTPGS